MSSILFVARLLGQQQNLWSLGTLAFTMLRLDVIFNIQNMIIRSLTFGVININNGYLLEWLMLTFNAEFVLANLLDFHLNENVTRT